MKIYGLENIAFIASVSLGALTACGGTAKQAIAPRLNVEATPLQSFSMQNVDFISNQILIWPDGIQSEQMAQVLRLADEIDELNRTAVKIKNRMGVLNKRLKSLETEVKTKATALEKKKKEVAAKGDLLTQSQGLLKEALQKEKAEKERIPPDAAALQLASELVKQETEKLAELQADLEKGKKEQGELQADADQKALELKNHPDNVERSGLEDQRKKDTATGTNDLGEITKVTELFDTPSSIFFEFQADGIPAISISDWTYDSAVGPVNFSSHPTNGSKPTIRNIKYTELGGKWEFEIVVYEDAAQTQISHIYSLNLARTNYGAEKKIYMGGDLVLHRFKNGEEETRYGVAKLVDNKS